MRDLWRVGQLCWHIYHDKVALPARWADGIDLHRAERRFTFGRIVQHTLLHGYGIRTICLIDIFVSSGLTKFISLGIVRLSQQEDNMRNLAYRIRLEAEGLRKADPSRSKRLFIIANEVEGLEKWAEDSIEDGMKPEAVTDICPTAQVLLFKRKGESA